MTGLELNPAWTLLLGAAVVPLLRGRWRSAWVVALPLVGMVQLWLLPHGEFGRLAFLSGELLLLRVDRWSALFALVFLIAALV
ncbi:MAG TPA: Na(+)/H(+) antiporter subunit D, partial [Myxococcota bacterium]|nr:Na(+)/H(+) antiporter subunit D [Myxococcota bacterium]